MTIVTSEELVITWNEDVKLRENLLSPFPWVKWKAQWEYVPIVTESFRKLQSGSDSYYEAPVLLPHCLEMPQLGIWAHPSLKGHQWDGYSHCHGGVGCKNTEPSEWLEAPAENIFWNSWAHHTFLEGGAAQLQPQLSGTERIYSPLWRGEGQCKGCSDWRASSGPESAHPRPHTYWLHLSKTTWPRAQPVWGKLSQKRPWATWGDREGCFQHPRNQQEPVAKESVGRPILGGMVVG